jgi:hypothetical protein
MFFDCSNFVLGVFNKLRKLRNFICTHYPEIGLYLGNNEPILGVKALYLDQNPAILKPG